MTSDSNKTPAVPLRVRTRHGESGEMATLTDGLDAEPAPTLVKNRASLTVLTGDGIGKLIRLHRDELVIGRSTEADFQFSDSSLSRRHARFFLVDHRMYVQDLESTNGTYVGGRRIDSPVALDDGDHVQLGSHRVLRFNLSDADEEDAAIELYESTVRDPTSGTYNRHYFDLQLAAESAHAVRQGTSLSILLVDIDEFKRLNDEHGHVTGDGVLRVLAASIQRLLRHEDTLVRYGGDEFVVLCRRSSLRNALILAERIRATVARLQFSAGGNDFSVSVSVGVASGRSGERHWGSLVEAADRAMYRAKGEGRNSVVGNE